MEIARLKTTNGQAHNIWWFHEVYNMPTENDGSDRWQGSAHVIPRS